MQKWPVMLMVVLMSPVSYGQERTSENHDRLARFLKANPAADTNKDGVLTMKEVRAFNAKRRGRQRRPRQHQTPPTCANVKYGPHERNVIDFWQAKSDSPTPVFVFFHGGGFRAGDKMAYNRLLQKLCLDSGISFAAANYRLSKHALYPAQMHDSARAIQFIRSKAGEWHIDATRIAAHGGSAGSGISLWLAFHDDLADPNSEDPVARQSSRLTCAVAMGMQSTYDPREIKKVVPGKAYSHPALKQLHGLPDDWDWDTAEIDEALSATLKDSSPITHLTKDDPPTFLFHHERSERIGDIHHPNFGRHLKKAMDELEIECIHHLDADYDNSGASTQDMFAFVERQFGME